MRRMVSKFPTTRLRGTGFLAIHLKIIGFQAARLKIIGFPVRSRVRKQDIRFSGGLLGEKAEPVT